MNERIREWGRRLGLAVMAAMMAIGVFAMSACTTADGRTDVDRLAGAIEGVAFVGTAAVLENNPGSRALFEEAVEAIRVQEASESIDYDVLVTVLRRLPIEVFQDEDSMLYVAGGKIVFDEAGIGEIELGETGERLRTLAAGLRAGIERGIKWTEPPGD